MKINSNEGLIGGQVFTIKPIADDMENVTVWIENQEPEQNGYTPKPVQIRAVVSASLVASLSITKGCSLIANVEIKTHFNVGKNNSKVNITDYVITDILCYSKIGECLANDFLLGGTIGKIEEKTNSAWVNVSLALQKSKNEQTQWVRLSIHNNFITKAFNGGLQKGDNLLVKAKLKTSTYDDRNGNRVISNDFHIDRVLMHDKKYQAPQQQNLSTPQSGIPLDNSTQTPQNGIPLDNNIPMPTDDYSATPESMLNINNN